MACLDSESNGCFDGFLGFDGKSVCIHNSSPVLLRAKYSVGGRLSSRISSLEQILLILCYGIRNHALESSTLILYRISDESCNFSLPVSIHDETSVWVLTYASKELSIMPRVFGVICLVALLLAACDMPSGAFPADYRGIQGDSVFTGPRESSMEIADSLSGFPTDAPEIPARTPIAHQ
jgi:hypothetical protein